MTNDTINLTIFGDICPVKDTTVGFASGDPSAILSKDILSLIAGSDLTIGNLECAVTNSPKPIKKTGPVLYTASSNLKTLATAGFTALSLANNHIKDCGSDGVESTINFCRDNEIHTFGAGQSQEIAKTPFIANIKGRKIAFIAYAEEEFNAASASSSGAAILDVYYDFDKLAQLRKGVDHLIVLYHGGIEYHPYPSPLLRKRCLRIADAGADLVICQHSHCIGSYEKYAGSTIIYGQGNNLFGYRRNNNSWNQGLLVQVTISNNNLAVNCLPVSTNDKSILELATGEDALAIVSAFEERSKHIKDDAFIAVQWDQFCRKLESLDIPLLLGWNRYLIYLNRKLRGLPAALFYGRRKRNVTHNLIRCESHNEVIRTILSRYNFD